MKTKLFLSIFFVFAVPLCAFGYAYGTPRYAPGETLEPDCLPSDINCTVTSPAISGANSDITSLSALTAITSGVLGVGTTSPYAKLSVTNTSTTQPALAVYGFNSQTSPLMLVASTTGTATSTAFIIDSNGKVGIGTTTPSQQLSVAGNGYFTGSLLANSITGTSLNIGSGLANMLAGFDANGNLTSTSSPQVAYINATSSTATSTFAGGLSVAGATGLNVLQNGKVGIGTTSVSSKLTLAGGNFTHTASGNPTLVGTYNTSGITKGIYVSGKYAYVADDTSGLQIIDISDPSSPNLTGTYNTSGNAEGIYVSGKYAYVADAYSGLQIIDISNPSSPTLTGTYDTNWAYGIYVSGKYAYVADDSSGLQIIDISNPANSTLKGTYNTSGNAKGVYVSGKYAYVADDSSGLQIIDISNPTSPILVGTYNTSGFSYKVYVSGKYAYVADDSSNFQIIDISNPSSPTLTGTYNTSGSALGVYVSGKYAYVVEWGSGLQVIDISNPANPTLAGTYDTSGLARGIYVSGKYAYVADDTSGLQIIDINGIETPSLYAGNINTNDLTVTENVDVGNNLFVRNGLNVGTGGIFTDGVLSVTGTSSSYIAGNLGLGTTSPYAKLSVTNTSTTQPALEVYGFNSQTSPLILVASTTGTATSTVFIIDSNGKVGVGTSTPSSELAITQGTNTSSAGIWLAGTDGDYRAIYMSDTSGVLSFNGGDTAGALNTATLNAAGAWTNASDISYKENITDLNMKYTLADLMKLTPRFYNMKGTNKNQIGFIAQEMKLVVPEVVEGQDGSMGISYGNLVALVVEGIKELSKKVDNLISKIEAEMISFKNVIADTFMAKQKLCINNTCVTESQLQALLQNANLSNMGNSINQIDNASSTNSTLNSFSSTTLPIITLLGDNPARIEKGVTFVDPGATAKDSNGLNLMPDLFSNDVDTNKVGDYTVVWEVHDSSMNYATTTRTVVVFDPYASSTEVISSDINSNNVSENEILSNEKLLTPN